MSAGKGRSKYWTVRLIRRAVELREWEEVPSDESEREKMPGIFKVERHGHYDGLGIWHLEKLKEKLATSDGNLDEKDRALLQKLVSEIFDGRDARRLFISTRRHRPNRSAFWQLHAAILVLLAIEKGTPEKAAKLDVGQQWGLSEDQVKHAMRAQRQTAEAVLAEVHDRDGLLQFSTHQMSLWNGEK